MSVKEGIKKLEYLGLPIDKIKGNFFMYE